MRLAVVAAVGVGALIATLLPSASVAGTAVYEDRRGDAPAASDVHRVRYTNAKHTLRIRIVVRELRRRAMTFYVLTRPPRMGTATMIVRARRTATGAHRQVLQLATNGGVQRVPCKVRTHWKPRADIVRIAVPQRCLARIAARGKQIMRTESKPPGQMNPSDVTRRVPVKRG